MNPNPKSIFASKTAWFNIGLMLVGLSQQLGLTSLLPEPWGPLATQAIGAVGLWLRTQTSQPVALTTTR